MQFFWEERKNRSNLRKHGFGFELASEVFLDPFCLTLESQVRGSELRFKTIGRLENLQLIVVIHTSEDDEGEEVRIISARKATPSETRLYEAQS